MINCALIDNNEATFTSGNSSWYHHRQTSNDSYRKKKTNRWDLGLNDAQQLSRRGPILAKFPKTGIFHRFVLSQPTPHLTWTSSQMKTF